MSRVKQNIIANYLGSGWSAAISILVVPVYIKLMGVESYGLVGFFTTMQAVFGLLDMGLSITLNREIARLSFQSGNEQKTHDFVRTLEVLYWATGLLIGICIITLAPLIAHKWISAKGVSSDEVERAIIIMGLLAAFQWPTSLYSGGLQGLQRQVILNVITAGVVTFKTVGAILVLWLLSRTVHAFFMWQTFAGLVGTIMLAWFLWRNLPPAGRRASFHLELLRPVWRFSAGMFCLAVTGVVLSQLDKIILSRAISLEMFGYYSLAGVAAGAFMRLASPFVAALFPRFVEFSNDGKKEEDLKILYHKSCQLLAVIVLPLAVVICLFPREVLLVWTRSGEIADKTAVILCFLTFGTALNAIMTIPGILQGSHGWISLALRANLVSGVILVPLIIVMAIKYGAVGASSVWALLNVVYVIVIPYFLHCRLLVTEMWSWYKNDFMLPLAASLLVATLVRVIIPLPVSLLAMVCHLAFVFLLTLSVTLTVTPFPRMQMGMFLARLVK
ncbi:MAG: oligosaccharide flippase family protein [Kiritimatiellae bacterium]|nr:oligosaccharide flippase family protein [Kiritimatiellia bacterium]MDD5523055.1 oligosaccharide flippase family protein [Kiritimatiellia bacterium]